MSSPVCVLLYSKFSQNCQDLISLIQQNELSVELQPICIDDKETRMRVTRDKRYNFSYVPCILLVNVSGVVEKFEANQAFEFVNMAIVQSGQGQEEQEHQPAVTPIDDYDEPDPTPVQAQAPTRRATKGVTPIADLVGEEPEQPPPRPQGGVQTNITKVSELIGANEEVISRMPIVNNINENNPVKLAKKVNVNDVMNEGKAVTGHSSSVTAQRQQVKDQIDIPDLNPQFKDPPGLSESYVMH